MAAVADPWKIYKYGDPEILRLTSKTRFLSNGIQDYQQILAANRGTGWVDPEFPHNGRSMGDVDAARDTANKEYAKGGGGGNPVQWVRIKDWIQNQAESRWSYDPKFDESSTPVFNDGDFGSGLARHDIQQREIGDCWFVASLSAVASDADPGMIRRLVPSDNVYNDSGVYHFVFWYDGIWIDVPVDDYLPFKFGKQNRETDALTDNLRTVGCDIPKTENGQAEFWVPMFEKAYAKLHGSYETIAGNWPVYALENMTGGFTEWIDLDREALKRETYEQIKEQMVKRSILVLTCPKAKARQGLIAPHCYSIIGADTVYEYGSRPVKLLKIRNPHGKNEWTGDWSDPPAPGGYARYGSRWNNVSDEEKQALGVQAKNDGEFFMAWEDIQPHFSRIDIVDLLRESELKDPNAIVKFSAYHGEWSNENRTSGGINSLDNCPQYTVTVGSQDPSGLAILFVGLLQKHTLKNDRFSAKGVRVFKVYDESQDAPYGYDFFLPGPNAEQQAVEGGVYEQANRTLTRAYKLRPGKYVIVPFLGNGGEEGKFFLRVLAQTKGAWKTN